MSSAMWGKATAGIIGSWVDSSSSGVSRYTYTNVVFGDTYVTVTGQKVVVNGSVIGRSASASQAQNLLVTQAEMNALGWKSGKTSIDEVADLNRCLIKYGTTPWLAPSDILAQNKAMIDGLDPAIRDLAWAFLAAANDAGYALFITWGRRTQAQIDELIKGGVTDVGTTHKGGMAFDVAFWDPKYAGDWPGNPVDFHFIVDWDPSDPRWNAIGPIGIGIGLSWGKYLYNGDLPHFELRK